MAVSNGDWVIGVHSESSVSSSVGSIVDIIRSMRGGTSVVGAVINQEFITIILMNKR